MNKIKTLLFFLLFISSFKAFSADVIARHGAVLGNETGSVLSVSGKKSVTVNMAACHFRISLEAGQNLIFNDPDVVFYESKSAIKKSNLPYLWQADMPAGYDWAFKKAGGLGDKWFGLMCDSSENFSWSDGKPISGQREDVTPERKQIRDSNDLKCPARIKDGKWVPTEQITAPKNYLFKELKGVNWSGFIVGYKNEKSASTLDSLRFCLVHDSKVIIGASENYLKPLSLPVSFFDSIQQSISTIEFVDRQK